MLSERVLHTVEGNQLIQPGEKVVVAVSGGADSLALLHILLYLREQLDIHLHVATLDHGLRGEASAADADYVVEVARAWGLPYTHAYRPPSAAMQAERGPEAAARIVRYAFLAEVAHRIESRTIATGHHADDQAETVLLHLLRGSAYRGLSGMGWRARMPSAPDLYLIRPLLGLRRAEIESYCSEHDLNPRHDASNRDEMLKRNAIRHRLLPQLHHFNPRIVETLNRLAESAAVDEDYIQSQFRELVMQEWQISPVRVRLSRELFAGLHPALQRRFVLEGLRQLHGSTEGISHARVLQAVRTAKRGQVGALVLLSGDIRFVIEYDDLVLEAPDAADDGLHPQISDSQFLPESGRIRLNSWMLRVESTPFAGSQIQLEVPDGVPLLLRGRQPGDRFRPAGMAGHSQKLKEWLIDHKIPHGYRDRLPLIIVDDQIIALALGTRWVLTEKDTNQEAVNVRSVYLALWRMEEIRSVE